MNLYISCTKLLFLDCNNLGSNTVQITSSLRAQSAATIGVLFDQFQCFQRLKAFASDTTGSCTPMAGSASIVTTNSINLGYSAYTNGLSDVDVSGHGSQPGVVPIFIIRGQLLGDVTYHRIL